MRGSLVVWENLRGRDDGLAIANSSVTYRTHARQESGASSIRRKNSARLRLRPRVAPSHRVSKFIRLLNASEEIFGSIVGRLSRKLFPSSSAIFSFFFFPLEKIRQEDTRNISLCANSTYESIRLINSFSENTERFGRFEKRAGTYEN